MTSHKYGPSALVTPANIVTLLRVAIAPIVFVMMFVDVASWKLTGTWILLTSTDGVDGFLARRQGTTRSGAFLDPLADKILIIGACITLMIVKRFFWLPVWTIIVREIVVSLYRVFWARRGIAIPARSSAKLKTFAQSIAVGWAICPPLAKHVPIGADILLWFACIVAIWSAWQYMRDGASARTTMAD